MDRVPRRNAVSIPHAGNLVIQISSYEWPFCAFYKHENARQESGTRGPIRRGCREEQQSPSTPTLIVSTEASLGQETMPLRSKDHPAIKWLPPPLASVHAFLAFLWIQLPVFCLPTVWPCLSRAYRWAKWLHIWVFGDVHAIGRRNEVPKEPLCLKRTTKNANGYQYTHWHKTYLLFKWLPLKINYKALPTEVEQWLRH